MANQKEVQLELAVSRTPGRPCLGDAPLTPAEKQRRYRERQHHKNVTLIVNRDDVATLSQSIAFAKYWAGKNGMDIDVESVNRLIEALDRACGGTTFK